jgi:hypothetical protein
MQTFGPEARARAASEGRKGTPMTSPARACLFMRMPQGRRYRPVKANSVNRPVGRPMATAWLWDADGPRRRVTTLHHGGGRLRQARGVQEQSR